MSADRRPDFLCVGAQKAGTSWLHVQLSENEVVWLPPSKELHYFDCMHKDKPLKRSKDMMARARLRRLEKINSSEGQAQLNAGRRKAVEWIDSAVSSDEVGLSWYEGLFPSASDCLVRGDMTPAYSTMSKSDFEYIRGLYPDIKIIFLMREPVSRMWSLVKQRTVSKLGKPELLEDINYLKEFSSVPLRDMKGRYDHTIRVLDEVFPAENLLFAFYEEIFESADSSGVFLSKVHDFLGLSSKSAPLSAVSHVNASPEVRIPEEFECYLSEKYRDVRSFVFDRFGRPRGWAE
jgi:hypothetical protein